MKVILVCINGLTTNILANRLQTYAREHEKKDSFLTCRIYSYREMLDGADAFLLAPQTSGQNEELCQACRDRQIPCMVMDERTFVLNDLEQIYQWIDANRREDAAAVSRRLTIGQFRGIAADTLLWILFLAVFGLLFYGCSVLTGSELLYHLYGMTLGIIGLYVPIAMGYFYGERTGHSPIISSLKMVMLLLIIMPVLRYSGNWKVALFEARVFSTSEVLFLEYFRVTQLPAICLISVLGLLAVEWGNRLFQTDKENLWSVSTILGNTFAILAGIVIRYVFLWIL